MSTVVRPLKTLGQHFLIDDMAAQSIVDSVGIGPEDDVVEIGPGEGVLTELILETQARSLTAIELDKRLISWLSARFDRDKRFNLINEDVMNVDLLPLHQDKKLRIIGNLPYSITTPILFRMLDFRDIIRDVTVTIQKEVAERLASPPGCKAYGIPSVFFQLYGRVETQFHIPRSSFLPVPGVDSSVIHIEFLEKPNFTLIDSTHFKRLVKTAFGQRRKMLRNSIKSLVQNHMSNEDVVKYLTRRPEALSVEEWAELSNTLSK